MSGYIIRKLKRQICNDCLTLIESANISNNTHLITENCEKGIF